MLGVENKRSPIKLAIPTETFAKFEETPARLNTVEEK